MLTIRASIILRLEERIADYQAYWKAAAEPKNQSPEDGSILELLRTPHDKAEDGMPRIIHAAWCKKRKHIREFEHDKGGYKPDPESQKRMGSIDAPI
ncbi:MAG: hypothetical protein LC802_23175 [Acidobacteria bacterium]|nr:hypothetical protein [Acidobacteriota bacterium]